MKHIHWIAFGTLVLGGCASEQSKSTIIVPSTATTAPSYRGDGSVPRQRYVIRMSDGKRDWEVEFPEVATGYEVRIPLGTDEVKKMRRDRPEMEREGVFVDGKNINDPDGKNAQGGARPGAELDKDGNPIAPAGPAGLGLGEEQPAPSRPSYLLSVEEIQKLYRSGNYELAMVRMGQLEKAYPNDAKLLSMKGTLWLKLGQKDLAREAWEQVLQIDPNNRAVIEAIKRLDD